MTSFLIKHFVKNSEDTENSAVRTSYGRLCGWVGIISNLILFIIKFTAGTISNSISITADAFNNLSDSASSIISFLGFKLASKPADEEHPYGHGRYEYISALIVTAVIIVIGIELLKTSIEKIISSEAAEYSVLSVIILVISVLVKLWMSLFNKHIGRKINSAALLASAKDSANDVITTLAVLLSIAASFIFKINIDGICGLLVALFILWSSTGLIKESLGTLLGNAPDRDFTEHIKKVIMSYPDVIGTHDLIVHDYGPGRRFASVHVEVAAEEDVIKSHDCIDNIERYFLIEEGLNLIIHMDPIVTENEAVSGLRSLIEREVRDIDLSLSIHDLRVVPGTTHTNVIFDCVVPPSSGISYGEIRKRITSALSSEYENHFAVITFESSYSPIPKNKEC